MAFGNSTMTQDELGRLAANLLHRAFVEATRTVSKGLYRRLIAGEVVPVTQLELADDQTVQLNMKLDTSEFRGDINFSQFRDGVVSLLQQLIPTLKSEGQLKSYHAKDQNDQFTDAVLLGVTGPTQHGADVNVMMISMTPSKTEPQIEVGLMYMNPDQFVSANRGES